MDMAAKVKPRDSGLSAHIPGMAAAMESVSDKLKATGEGAIFKRHSGAADVIVVSYCSTGHEQWKTSNFHVHVGRDAKLGQSLQGVTVEVFVNEAKTPLTMTVDDKYRCTFEGGELRPNDAQVRALGRVLLPGRNVVRYQLSGNRALFDIHACIYLWDHTDKVVVCDIDGTVTRSDFLGYSAHLMGYEYTHDGVTDVLNYLHELTHIEHDGVRHLHQGLVDDRSDGAAELEAVVDLDRLFLRRHLAQPLRHAPERQAFFAEDLPQRLVEFDVQHLPPATATTPQLASASALLPPLHARAYPIHLHTPAWPRRGRHAARCGSSRHHRSGASYLGRRPRRRRAAATSSRSRSPRGRPALGCPRAKSASGPTRSAP